MPFLIVICLMTCYSCTKFKAIALKENNTSTPIEQSVHYNGHFSILYPIKQLQGMLWIYIGAYTVKTVGWKVIPKLA